MSRPSKLKHHGLRKWRYDGIRGDPANIFYPFISIMAFRHNPQGKAVLHR